MSTLAYLLLELSPLLVLNLISCQLCNSNIVWIILILLDRNVDQDETTCCVQEGQIRLTYFWSYRPVLCLNLISCRLQERQLWRGWGWGGDICLLFVFCWVFSLFFFFFFFFFCFFFVVVVFLLLLFFVVFIFFFYFLKKLFIA